MEQNQEDENNRCNTQNIHPNNPSHGSSLGNDKRSSEERWYIWVSMQYVVFFEIIVYENQKIYLM